MPEYIVTYTSMVIEAESEEAAVDRAGDTSGGSWEAKIVPAPVDDLARAIQRGQSLIDLGADEGEDEETQLSDVLADLMHWANHNHVDFHSAITQAERSRGAELDDWGSVEVRIANTYSDGHESVAKVWVSAPKDPEDLEGWWDEAVFPHTGDGHGAWPGSKITALHEARIINTHRNDQDTLLGQTNEWDG